MSGHLVIGYLGNLAKDKANSSPAYQPYVAL